MVALLRGASNDIPGNDSCALLRRASDDMLVAQKGARSEPDSLSAESRVLSL